MKNSCFFVPNNNDSNNNKTEKTWTTETAGRHISPRAQRNQQHALRIHGAGRAKLKDCELPSVPRGSKHPSTVCDASVCIAVPNIYTYTYTYIYIYIYIHTYLHTYTRAYMHAYIHIDMHICISYVYPHMYTQTHLCISTCRLM